MPRPNGGVIAGNQVGTSRGIWSLRDNLTGQRVGSWPNRDSSFSSVSLLLQWERFGSSTDFVDSSANNFALTRTGTPTVTTAQSRWGSGSLSLSGSGQYLSAGSNAAFSMGTGDFTIECWYRSATTNETSKSFLCNDATGGIYFGLESVSAVSSFALGRRAVAFDLSFAHTPPQNQWMHYAVTRSGTTARLFINGLQVASSTNSLNYAVNGPLLIGGLAALSSYTPNGNLGPARITKGVARYTGTFQCLDRPFPDSA